MLDRGTVKRSSIFSHIVIHLQSRAMQQELIDRTMKQLKEKRRPLQEY